MPRKSKLTEKQKLAKLTREAKARRTRERKERDREYGHLDPVARNLVEALIAAQSHLEYCGYGDRWEREYALTGPFPLDKEIEAALVNARRPK